MFLPFFRRSKSSPKDKSQATDPSQQIVNKTIQTQIARDKAKQKSWHANEQQVKNIQNITIQSNDNQYYTIAKENKNVQNISNNDFIHNNHQPSNNTHTTAVEIKNSDAITSSQQVEPVIFLGHVENQRVGSIEPGGRLAGELEGEDISLFPPLERASSEGQIRVIPAVLETSDVAPPILPSLLPPILPAVPLIQEDLIMSMDQPLEVETQVETLPVQTIPDNTLSTSIPERIYYYNNRYPELKFIRHLVTESSDLVGLAIEFDVSPELIKRYNRRIVFEHLDNIAGENIYIPIPNKAKSSEEKISTESGLKSNIIYFIEELQLEYNRLLKQDKTLQKIVDLKPTITEMEAEFYLTEHNNKIASALGAYRKDRNWEFKKKFNKEYPTIMVQNPISPPSINNNNKPSISPNNNNNNNQNNSNNYNNNNNLSNPQSRYASLTAALTAARATRLQVTENEASIIQAEQEEKQRLGNYQRKQARIEELRNDKLRKQQIREFEQKQAERPQAYVLYQSQPDLEGYFHVTRNVITNNSIIIQSADAARFQT